MRRALILLVLFTLCAGLIWQPLGRAAPATGAAHPAWASPAGIMAMRRVSSLTGEQHEPILPRNMDCSLLTYRVPASSTMQTGCFTDTAFGLMDISSQTVIFNGTDEGLPLTPNFPQQFLVPWPGTVDLLQMDPDGSGGTFVSLYKNPLPLMSNLRNFSGQLTGKTLNAPAEATLTDQIGRRLFVDPQAIAFSDNGSWLVAEVIGGSFVRINLATLQAVGFTPSFATSTTVLQYPMQVAVSDDGRYVAISNETAGTFKVYDLSSCLLAADNACPSYDYHPYLRQQASGLQAIRHVRFINDGLLSMELTSSTGSESGVYELAPSTSIGPLIDYLALGDSYTSGEGAFDYLSGTDTGSNVCHLSRRSYPLLLTEDLFAAGGGHSVACSGARINDIADTSSGYRGQVRDGLSLQELQQDQPSLFASVTADYLPGYLAQNIFVRQYQPRLLTVSVGGNDIGYGDIVRICAEPHLSSHLSASNCFNTYEDRLEVLNRIDKTSGMWKAAFSKIKSMSPGSTIYVIGYPLIAVDNGSCAVNVHLSQSELEFTIELTKYINAAMQQAAAAAGVRYIDIADALAGYRLCETNSPNVAVNGLTAGKDSGVLGFDAFGSESYHPNAFGEQLIEQAILHRTDNLSVATSGQASAPSSEAILSKPKSGRTVLSRVPATITSKQTVTRGTKVTVKVSGPGAGLQPNKSYTVSLGGSQGVPVGQTVSDASGNITTEVTIPAGTPPGGTTIDIIGQDQSDSPTDVTQPIDIGDSSSDSDGDGLPDASDSCPGAANSGQDSDADGIDDACDGFIGQPPTPTPPIAGSGTGTTSSGTGPGSISSGNGQNDQSTPMFSTSDDRTASPGTIQGSTVSVQSTVTTTLRTVQVPARSQSHTGTTPTLPVKQPARQILRPSEPASTRSEASSTSENQAPLLPLRYLWWVMWLCIAAAVFAITSVVFRTIEEGRGRNYARRTWGRA